MVYIFTADFKYIPKMSNQEYPNNHANGFVDILRVFSIHVFQNKKFTNPTHDQLMNHEVKYFIFQYV